MNGTGAGGAAVDRRGGTPEELAAIISDETAGRLRMLAGRIPPDELSEVWVFPPLEDVEGSDEFHLFTRRMGEGVYRVCAAEFAAVPEDLFANGPGAANGNGAAEAPGNGAASADADVAPGDDAGDAAAADDVSGGPRVTVYGAVPEARVARLVANFRDRLGDGREPLYLPIYGSLERWRLAVGVDPETPADAAPGDAAPPHAAPESDGAATADAREAGPHALAASA